MKHKEVRSWQSCDSFPGDGSVSIHQGEAECWNQGSPRIGPREGKDKEKFKCEEDGDF